MKPHSIKSKDSLEFGHILIELNFDLNLSANKNIYRLYCSKPRF